MKIDDDEVINEKIKQLYDDWVKQSLNIEKVIEEELINNWVEKYGINVGDDILIEDWMNYRKLDKTIHYYRKAKLIKIYVDVSLNQYEKSPYLYIKPIIKVYKPDNKTLQKKSIIPHRLEFFKMDLNLLGKAILDTKE